jgi:cytidine deaminase
MIDRATRERRTADLAHLGDRAPLRRGTAVAGSGHRVTHVGTCSHQGAAMVARRLSSRQDALVDDQAQMDGARPAADEVARLVERAAAVAHPFAPSEDLRAGDVGAALLTVDGDTFTGICIDAQCGLGFCAEHAAVAEMLKAGQARVRLIVAVDRDGTVMSPCGRCRELLWQLSPDNRTTWVVGSDRSLKVLTELLPDK